MFAHPKEGSFFEDLKQYVGFTSDSTEALRELRPLAAPHYPEIVDDFQEAIRAYATDRETLAESNAHLAPLKSTLTQWVDTLLLGPHDEEYFRTRPHLGQLYAQLDLPQTYLFVAMSRIRSRLDTVLYQGTSQRPRDHRRINHALHQILDLELAIMLEAYRLELVARRRDTEHLAAVGQFAVGIGHELRSPLAIIDSSAFLLRRHLASDASTMPRVAEHLDRIQREVQRSTSSIRDLLGMARDQRPRRVPSSVRDALEAAVEAAFLPPAVTVEIMLPANLSGDFDPDQIGHVVINLLTNASEATSGRGRIRIEGTREGPHLIVRVCDDGPGVPADFRERIFEPLFTTKSKGIGLGLTLCRRIVESHGGEISLEDTTPGATFLLRLPTRVMTEHVLS